MFGFDEDGYDAHCYSCGIGYNFDVGMGPFKCSHCGGPIDKPKEDIPCSDEQYANTMLEFYLSMDCPKDLKNDEHINLKVVNKLIDEKIKQLNRFKKLLR